MKIHTSTMILGMITMIIEAKKKKAYDELRKKLAEMEADL